MAPLWALKRNLNTYLMTSSAIITEFMSVLTVINLAWQRAKTEGQDGLKKQTAKNKHITSGTCRLTILLMMLEPQCI